MSVLLKCIKIGGKLRIRIISHNYFNDHNCQFPRAIRLENALYEVPAVDVTLVTQSRNRAFYRIKRANIRIVTDESHTSTLSRNFKIFQDYDENDCAICLTERKHYVFGPCGHFYVCQTCAEQLKLCPICRANIDFKVDFRALQTEMVPLTHAAVHHNV